MDTPLVWKLPNSTILPLPGIWISKPGVKRMKSTTDTKTGPQSAIFSSSHSSSLCMCVSCDLFQWMVVAIGWFAKCIAIYVGCPHGKLKKEMPVEKVRLVTLKEETRNWWLGREKKFLSSKKSVGGKKQMLQNEAILIHILQLIPTRMPPTGSKFFFFFKRPINLFLESLIKLIEPIILLY